MDWADTAAEDGGEAKIDVDTLAATADETQEREALPEPEVTGPDAMGNKTIVEWYYNDDDEKVKKTTKIKVSKKAMMIKQAVLTRRMVRDGGTGKLFGKAVTQGNEGGITRIDSDISVTVTARVKEEKEAAAFKDAWKQRKQASQAKWGVKDYSKAHGESDDFWTKARDNYYGDDAGGGGGEGDGLQMKMTSSGGKNAYVPPARKVGASSSTMEGSRFGSRGTDVATVRITNLSEEATDEDVKLLCQPFGPVQRTYLAKDKHTQASKGFAFVNFHRREHAEKCIEKLNGYGYDNLILHVDWAKPSGDEDGKGKGKGDDKGKGGGKDGGGKGRY